MITQINLHYFKCFALLKLPLADLTLLSGSNASGKSSILQALVLLHQSMREQEWSIRLVLNGRELKMGTVADVVDKVFGRRTFEIALETEKKNYHWVFSGERDDMSLSIDRVRVGSIDTSAPLKLQYLLPEVNDQDDKIFVKCLYNLTYLSAERIGPRESYPLKDRQIATVVGPDGEDAVCLLHMGRDENILDKLVIKDVPPTRLKQVEARMKMFFPGFGLAVEKVPKSNAVTLGLRISDDTDFHRPNHVGFGLTQVLPIIVAALSAQKGDILLIENPEVHLHPAGQVLMGQFLAEVSNAGIQVVLETHSDHIFNGIRRAVKTNILKPNQVALHFFNPRSGSTAQVISPQIDKLGNVDRWPVGFFDQFDKDMNYFAGWRE